MKLPPKNSRTMAIVQALRQCGPVTLKEGIELHGSFNKMTLADMDKLYEELVTLGCLDRVGARYCVSEAVLFYYEPPQPKVATPLVPPRVVNRFTPPLDRRYFLSTRGIREGSNDLRAVPSGYAALEKA
jgi:hypothetical protein